MECINHTGIQASGTCNVCGKGLCSVCVERFETPLCEKCLLNYNNKLENKYYTELGITVSIFFGVFIWYLFSDSTKIDGFLFFAILVTCAYWGREAFKKNTPSVVMDMKMYGFLSIMRFIFAIVFGLFIAPFAIYKRIREIVKIRKIRKDIFLGNI